MDITEFKLALIKSHFAVHLIGIKVDDVVFVLKLEQPFGEITNLLILRLILLKEDIKSCLRLNQLVLWRVIKSANCRIMYS